jgi:hypothetical protein
MELKDTLAITISGVGATVAIATAIKALIEYRKQGVTKRAEIFLQMRSRLREDPSFKNICQLLETDDEELKEIPLIEKDRLIGFFEELALMKNSGFINDQVSLYMFGYFAVQCLDSKNFWHGLNKSHNLWALFMDFATQMKDKRQSFKYDRKNFHL